MWLFALTALMGGVLVSLSRQINGRLALHTTAMIASFWNHVVGLVALVLIGLATGTLWPGLAPQTPLWAWLGGPVGVIFVASGSWLIARIGATMTAILVIAGQMVGGVLLDLLMGVPGHLGLRAAGVALILGGMVLLVRRD